MKEFRSSRLRVWENISRTMQEFKVLLLGYRSYTALLTQTGTNAPVATVLENTLGVEPTYTYNDVGEYTVNTVISFDFNKIAFIFGNSSSQIILDIASYESGNEMFFQTSNNNQLYNYPIEIRVYN